MFSKLQELREERENGFTLIELLVVILIIGILSAIAIPAFLNQRKSAVDSTVKSDVSNAAKQVETWITKQGATVKPVPTTLDALGVQRSDGTEMTIKGTSGEYCIVGTNTGGDESKPENTGIVYSSSNGGMVTGEGICNEDGTFLPAGSGSGSETPEATGGFGIGQVHTMSGILYKQVVVTEGSFTYWDNGSEQIPFNVSFKHLDNDTTELTLEFPNGTAGAEGLTLAGTANASETDRATYGNDKGYGSATWTEIAPGTYTMNFSNGDLANANELGLNLEASNGQPRNTGSGSGFGPPPVNPDYEGFLGSASIYIG